MKIQTENVKLKERYLEDNYENYILNNIDAKLYTEREEGNDEEMP